MSRAVGSISRSLVALSAFLLFGMMVLTVADVAGRYFLARPVPGSVEIIQTALALAVAATLPVVTIRGGHISLSLLEGRMARPLDRLRRALVAALSAVTFAGLAWLLWGHAREAREFEDVIGYLEIPTAPMIYAFSIMAGLAAIAFVIARTPGQPGDDE